MNEKRELQLPFPFEFSIDLKSEVSADQALEGWWRAQEYFDQLTIGANSYSGVIRLTLGEPVRQQQLALAPQEGLRAAFGHSSERCMKRLRKALRRNTLSENGSS